MKSPNTEQMGIRMSPNLKDALHNLAEHTGTAPADLVRIAIRRLCRDLEGIWIFTPDDHDRPKKLRAEIAIENTSDMCSFTRDGDDGEWQIDFRSLEMTKQADRFKIVYLSDGRPYAIEPKK
jgi:hypothetical protein